MSEEDGQGHRTYTPDFKSMAVERSQDPTKTFTRVAEELGISPRVLRRWRNESVAGQEPNGTQTTETVHPDEFERDALQAAKRNAIGVRSRPTATRALVTTKPIKPAQAKKAPVKVKVVSDKTVAEAATDILRAQLTELRAENSQLRRERDAFRTTLKMVLAGDD